MKNDAVRTEKVKDLTINIFQDEDAMTPREWDNLGTIVTFHKRIDLGDKDHGFSSPDDLQIKLDKKGVVSLPIYMMDHSGLTVSTNPDMFRTCDPQGWDWGKLGYIFVEEDKIKKEYSVSEVTSELRDTVLSVLNSEIEVYNQFIQGDVYGYVIEDEDGNNLDSVWGFFGIENCLEEAKSHAESVIEDLVGSGVGI
jgi:hypothetical protein